MARMKYTATAEDGASEVFELDVWQNDKPFLAVCMHGGRVFTWNRYKTFAGALNNCARWEKRYNTSPYPITTAVIRGEDS